MEKLSKLSPKMQDAVFWIADNIEFVNHICRGKRMPKEMWEECIERAIEYDDDFGICLLVFKYIKDEEKSRRKK